MEKTARWSSLAAAVAGQAPVGQPRGGAVSEETYWLSIGWDGVRLHCADPDCDWSQPVEGCDRLWGSWIDDTLTAHVEEVRRLGALQRRGFGDLDLRGGGLTW